MLLKRGKEEQKSDKTPPQSLCFNFPISLLSLLQSLPFSPSHHQKPYYVLVKMDKPPQPNVQMKTNK